MRRYLTLLVLIALPLASSAAVSRYKLRRGDTLGGVARRLGVNADALARANGIKNPNKILAGQTLVIPTKAEAAALLKAAKTPAPAPAKPAAKPAAVVPMAPIVAVKV